MLNQKPLPQEDLNHILQYSKNAFDTLANAHIFMTGGTGFFGVWLLESMIQANKKWSLNIKTVVLTRDIKKFTDRFPHISKEKCIQFQQGDIRQFTFPTGKFSHIIHGATDASAELNAKNPIEMFEVIVQGTKHTFDFAKICDAKNILLISSGAVYGRQPPELLLTPETFLGYPDIFNPGNAYAGGKKAAEQLAVLYHAQHALNIKIARCFALVGPLLPLDIHFAMGNFILDILKKRNIAILGDGTPYRSYQYAADLIIWLLHILCFGKNVYPYNVGSDKAVSIAELANLIATFSPGTTISIAKKANNHILSERYVPSIERAKTELQLQNYIDLKDAIHRTITWYRS